MEYQRQLHLQRLAEQEAEMKARLEQQRFYAQQREQQNQVKNIFDKTSDHHYSSYVYFILDTFCSITITANIYRLLSSSISNACASIYVKYILDGTYVYLKRHKEKFLNMFFSIHNK